ncbi:MAG: transcriptional regulator, TraR/DksA family [Candidatus Solibacter sp.]|jgi:DnaK suppressor protein|nr:transcriptional regulator, TraR/DksA family [Candidatus Solibacter sp.]
MKKAVKNVGSHEVHRARLLEKRSSVLSGLGAKFDTRARMGRVAEDDQAQISHDEFVSLRMNGLDYRQLRMVEEALDRLEAGDYGICLACDEPIAEKRLQALPWARYCVKCEDGVGAEMVAGGTFAPPH